MIPLATVPADAAPLTWGYVAWAVGFTAVFIGGGWLTVEGIPRLIALHRRGMSRVRRTNVVDLDTARANRNVTVQGER